MDFRTRIEIQSNIDKIQHQDKILMLGSCFSQNIGRLLLSNKFDVDLNPFGVIYNPSSIRASIQHLLDKKVFDSKDVFEHKGLYHSFAHHSDFSHTQLDICLTKLNERSAEASQSLLNAKKLIITFGTAYVYALADSGAVVSNCHKLPANQFTRYRLCVSDIVKDWSALIEQLQVVNPHLQLVFTVSPIRHLRDGANDNQLSKSTLLLAIDELVQKYSQASYFPAYEIVMDDLRDYRFYAEDMTHPNELAIKYIWERFGETYFSDQTLNIMGEWTKISKAITHRSFNADTAEHQHFLKQTLLRLQAFANKYPYIYVGKEETELKEKITS